MRRIGLAVAGIGLVAAMSGCGGGDSGDGGDNGDSSGGDFADQSADAIVADAKSAMKDLDAVKVSGSLSTGGQDIDIDVQASGQGECTGSIGVADGSAELRGTDGKTWFRPDEAFWRASAGDQADQLISLVGDKWVVLPETEGFDQFCDIDQLLDQLLKAEDDGSTYTKKGTEDVDGEETVAIDNEDPENGTSTGYVLVDDPHYLVKVEKTDGEDTGEVTFSEFNEDFTVEAPPEDEVIDLNSLSG